MPPNAHYVTECAIGLSKDKQLSAVIAQAVSRDLPDLDRGGDFLIAEVFASIVVTLCGSDRKVDTVRETDNLFLF